MRSIKKYELKRALIGLEAGSGKLLRVCNDRLRQSFDSLGGDCLTDVVYFDGVINAEKHYDIIVYMRETGLTGDPLADEAFSIITKTTKPLTIELTSPGPRGCLFAAYRLADYISAQRDLDKLDESHKPTVEKRIASTWYDLTRGWQAVRRVGQSRKSIGELPRYGVNCVALYDTSIWPYIPIDIPDDPAKPAVLIEPQAHDLKAMFAEIKYYGMDVYMTYPYFDFPRYDDSEVRRMLLGEKEVDDEFLDYFASYNKRRLSAFFELFPDLDGIIGGGVEGSIGYSQNRDPQSLFREGMDDELSSKILGLYMKTLEEAGKKYNKEMCFHTHNFGTTSEQLVKMRDVFRNYPGVIIMEDDRWNNNGWMNLPIFGYLAEEQLRDVNKHNPYYIGLIADGEYFGGGLLPTCIPEPLYEAAELAVNEKFRGVLSRFDFHDRTEFGSLYSVNEINFIASLLPLWDPMPTMDGLWEEWAVTRFGREAAEKILPALKSGGDIIIKGCMISGADLLIGSIFKPHTMIGLVKGQPFFPYDYLNLFRPAGIPLIQKKDGEPIYSIDYKLYQLNSKTEPIEKIRDDQHRALELTELAIVAIGEAEQCLKPEDFTYLMKTYTTCRYVIKAIRAATEAIYYNRLTHDNYDNVDDPAGCYKKALDNLPVVSGECAAMQRNPWFDSEYDHLAENLGKLKDSLLEKF